MADVEQVVEGVEGGLEQVMASTGTRQVSRVAATSAAAPSASDTVERSRGKCSLRTPKGATAA